MDNPKIPHSYHISKGADNIFFILNDGEEYLKKLSTNYDTAKKLAVKLIKENDPNFFQDGNKLITCIWNRNKWQKEQKPKWLPRHFDHIDTHNNYLAKIRLENKKQELTKKYSKFSHIGNVGDKLDLELTITEIFTYPIYTEFSDRAICGYCHKFTDKNNNKLIYFGASKAFVEKYKTENDSIRDREIYKVGDKITIEATIKEHTIDKKDVDSETEIGMPLTVIARPKINKPKKERANV
jgi:hypothetical protein